LPKKTILQPISSPLEQKNGTSQNLEVESSASHKKTHIESATHPISKNRRGGEGSVTTPIVYSNVLTYCENITLPKSTLR